MSSLPPEQNKSAAPSTKGFTIWAAVVGLITTVLVYWILDEYTSGLRIGAAVVGGVAVAIAMYRKSVKAGLKPSVRDDSDSE